MVTRRSFLGGIAAAAAVYAQPRVARASVARPVSLGELLYESRYVVLGQAMNATAHWERIGERSCIVTHSVVRVEESLGARVPQSAEVVVRTLGGSAGGLGQTFHGEAEVALRERAVIFLRDAGPGIFSVTGMAQGYYPVRTDEHGVTRLSAAFEAVTFAGANSEAAAMRRLHGRTVFEVESMLADEATRANL